MANRLKMKQSSVAGKVPATTDLLLGELAVNTTDGKLYLKKNVSGTETIVDVTAGGLLPASATDLGGVKGLTNLTIDAAGNLSLSGANVSAALGFSPLDSANSSKLVPAGTVLHVAMGSAPNGWLKANGAVISRSTYAALFSAIGTTYGAGDGSTTFRLPDLRGEFLRGFDDGRGIDSGRSLGSAQVATNVFVDDDYAQTIGAPSWTNDLPGMGYEPGTTGGTFHYSIYGGNVVGVGAGSAYVRTIRPRNVALLACIKY